MGESFLEKVSRFDRISRRGVHLPFRGVQPGPRGVQILEGVHSSLIHQPRPLRKPCSSINGFIWKRYRVLIENGQGVQISAGVQSERYGHINLALAKNHYFTDTFSCRATLIAVTFVFVNFIKAWDSYHGSCHYLSHEALLWRRIAVAICYLISILPGVKTVIDIIINCSH